MSEANKAVVARAFEEVLNGNRLELIPELYAEDFQGCDPANDCDVCGCETLAALVDGYRKAFPGHVYELHELIGEGDHVCARWTIRSNSERFSEGFKLEGLSLCEVRDGKIAKVWQHWDNLAFLQEMGVVERDLNLAEAVSGLVEAD